MSWDATGAPKKPGLLCIGAQKAGTTWLSQMLGQHPAIWTPPFKEVQYFNHRFIPEHRKWTPWHFKRSRQNLEKRHAAKGEALPPHLAAYLDDITSGKMFDNPWYKRVFAPAPDGSIGFDATPEYSTLPEEGVAFVAKFLPKARFVYIIRHPVDRAISQLKMNMMRKRRAQKDIDWMAEIDDPVLLNRGDYATYLPRWQAHFGADRLLVLPFGLIAQHPALFLRRIEDFTGLTPHSYTGLNQKVFAAPSGLHVPDEARAALRARLEPQFAFLEETLGRDFTAMMR